MSGPVFLLLPRRIYSFTRTRMSSTYRSIAEADFRSDTVTTPTPSMLQAMLTATHGDDVFQEDQSTNDLQARVARLSGKEQGLFVVSGTMGNQISIRAHLTQPPYSVLCDYRSHIYNYEAAGLAMLSQSMVIPVHPVNGRYMTAKDVESHLIHGTDIHTAPTRVISLENTLNGTILPLEEIKKIFQLAKYYDIRLHLDGARLWNASAETGIPISEYGQYFDSMSLCLSKGLGAPVGTVVVGDSKFISKCNWFRKQTGGGIRQAGVLAAAANMALTESFPGKLKATHEIAKHLAAELATDYNVQFESPVETCFLWLDLVKSGINSAVLQEQGEKLGIKITGNRIAIHHQIHPDAIAKLKLAIKASIEIKHQVGFDDLKEFAYSTLKFK
ncbi:pyridoxal phosphate-dependent transferase [Lipomyces japonicus]|uniref:pyridoxal phosphate-dependent transferase n=1 Tax=Lipomyces japonicus TaxID=56871 RepID=UPI0034CED725